jgi:SAM-dependent MidA family methyltransferase
MKMPAAAIREEILKNGDISFARFMELALYCPETGYYERKSDSVGRRGDFMTSVSAGSLFGELLAFQFAEWLGEWAMGDLRFTIAEAGAHDGRLAADVLGWLQASRPKLFARMEYAIIEPSPVRRRWQAETLAPFAPRVRWVARAADLESRQLLLLFANELLDAFPVHRLGWDAAEKTWFEWGVGLAGENFRWQKLSRPSATGALAGTADFAAELRVLCPPELEQVLPDGYVVEFSPAAENWWREAAGILEQGRLLTIDYGLAAGEMFSPARTRGTLRAFHRHQVSDDLLAQPGEQDLTAHVNFSAIQQAGEAAGLRTEQFCAQPQFLTRILQKAAAEKSFGPLNAKQVRQFQTLTHPEHLGRAFRVLVQGHRK